MDYSQFVKDLHLIWQMKPELIVLLLVGFVIFLLVVVDAHKHKASLRRLKGPQQWISNFWHQTRNCRPVRPCLVRPLAEQRSMILTCPAGAPDSAAS